MNPSNSLLGVLAMIIAASSEAAIDLEGAVPAGWSESGGGSLSISDDHYQLGTESVNWAWQGGDSMTAQGVSIDSTKVLDFYHNTCDFWIYSNTITPGEVLTVEFLDGADAVQWRFKVQMNFIGWRHILRSYKYDMDNVGGGTDLQSVRFLAPQVGSGDLYFDDIEWVRSRLTRHRDRAMPDIDGYLSSTLFHDLENLLPNLPPDPATAAELAVLPRIESDCWASTNGANPSSEAVTTAKNAFATWNIVRNGSLIKGRPIDRDSIDEVGGFLGVLAREWHHDGDLQARDMTIDMIEHLLDQGWAGGSSESVDGGSDTYSTREVIRALLILRNDYSPATRAAVEDLLQWRLKRGFFWDPNIGVNKDTDYIHTESPSLMGLVLGFSDTEQEKVEGLRGLKQYFERFIAFSPGTSDGIKPDGTGFHHWTHYNNYMYAFGQLANQIYMLRDSPFMVNQASYEIFRDSCYVMGIMANDIEFANGFSGRTPLRSSLPVSGASYARLAKAGGSFYGEAADPKIAQFHNRVWGGDPTLLAFGSEDIPTGFWQFNYSPAGIYRTGHAVITIKGLTDTFWGTEIYSTSNRYGRYQSYGSIEVMYPGGRATSGMNLNGWDWNSPPGTTTIRLPFADLKAIAPRQDEVAQTRMAGALSVDLHPNSEFGVKGHYGLFGMKFQQKPISSTHNETFTFRKSVFAFDGKLLCLGSDIANDDTSHETITTLFQVAMPSPSTPTIHQGAELAAFPLNTTWTSGPRWFLDHVGTGYYLPGDHVVKLARSQQSSPPESGSGENTTGDFTKAWISHGTTPTGEDYEYVILPESSGPAMAQFSTNMAGAAPPYSVLQKNSEAHVVHLKDEEAYGYVCFDGAPEITHGPVTETSRSALVMTKQTGNYLHLSYSNPELDLEFRVEEPTGFVTTDIHLAGEWIMDSGDPRAELLPQEDGTTRLRFVTQHGLPVELGLIQTTSYENWQSQFFTESEIADVDISGRLATPAADGVANAFKYAWSLDPKTPTTLAPYMVVDMVGGLLTAQYDRDRSRPDAQLALEASTDLVHWTPLPAVLTDDQSGIERREATLPVSTSTRQFIRLGALVEP